MCCPAHCASYCAPCQPLLRAVSGWCAPSLSSQLSRGAAPEARHASRKLLSHLSGRDSHVQKAPEAAGCFSSRRLANSATGDAEPEPSTLHSAFLAFRSTPNVDNAAKVNTIPRQQLLLQPSKHASAPPRATCRSPSARPLHTVECDSFIESELASRN